MPIKDSEPVTALFRGRLCHSFGPDHLEILHDALLVVRDGAIACLYEFEDIQDGDLNLFLEHEGFSIDQVINLSPSQFLIPGLIDTHIHAPQFTNAGYGMDLPLLEWLEKYTFPTESAWKDSELAQKVSETIVQETLKHGSTTACYYSSTHVEATKRLADVCLASGQRAFIGKCCMDTHAPDYYRETCEESLTSSRECLQYIKQIDVLGEQLTCCVTPRFAPSCSRELLRGLGDFAAENTLPIQTHISENVAEVQMVADMFPEFSNYTEVYAGHGLLTPRTILAHAIYLSTDELNTIRQAQVGIAHCPASNTGLCSGEAPVREMLDMGIKVGLGTDVSGGYTPSILDSARLACAVSRHRVIRTGDKKLQLNASDVLYMATLGGAKVCGFDDQLGNFMVGKSFDALIIDVNAPGTRIRSYRAEDTDDMIINKWLFNGDDRNITEIFIRGRHIMSHGLHRGHHV